MGVFQNRGVCGQEFPPFPSPPLSFHFFALASLFVQPECEKTPSRGPNFVRVVQERLLRRLIRCVYLNIKRLIVPRSSATSFWRQNGTATQNVIHMKYKLNFNSTKRKSTPLNFVTTAKCRFAFIVNFYVLVQCCNGMQSILLGKFDLQVAFS